MIDTHSHVYLSEFDSDREVVIDRARAAGIELLLMPNVDEETFQPMLSVAEAHPGFCLPMAGLHPTSVGDNINKQLKAVERQLLDSRMVAIGETGIDLYWDKSHADRQFKAFDYHMNLAYETQLPIVIHARDALDEIFAYFEKWHKPMPAGVLHCFPGDYEQAERAVSYGFFLGIGGVVTYKNSFMSEVVKRIPLEKLLTETDSPYLPPVPHRGKRNEPGFVKLVIERIAVLKEMDFAEVAEATASNARRLFGRCV